MISDVELLFICLLAIDAVVVVQLPSFVQLFATPWTTACQPSLSFIISWSLLQLMSFKLVMPSNHLILSCPFSSCLQSFSASESFRMSQFFALGGQNIGVLASASVLPVSISGLISFRKNWLDLLAVQGTLESLLQHHSFEFYGTLILWYSAFFIVQLSHPYMTTGKTITLMQWTFANKVMSLLFNMLSRLVKLSFQGVRVF